MTVAGCCSILSPPSSRISELYRTSVRRSIADMAPVDARMLDVDFYAEDLGDALNIRGSCARARAMCRRCRSPPESVYQ